MELFWIGIFIISLAVLIKSADYFTTLSRKFALVLGIPSFIIGVTVVAFGTSVPELFTSIIAVLNNASEVVPGVVIGSNISNILLVLGVCAIISKNLRIDIDIIAVHLPLLVGSAILLFFMLFDGIFTWKEGILLILAYVIYVMFSKEEFKDHRERKEKIKSHDILMYILMIVLIYFGSKYTVESLIQISNSIGIGAEIIAATAVALGTSLPELMVSMQAILKKDLELSVGNILGSNIFNTSIVMGVSSLFGTIIIPSTIINFVLPFMLAITILYFFVSEDRTITKWEGWMMIILYLFFIGMTFGLFS